MIPTEPGFYWALPIFVESLATVVEIRYIYYPAQFVVLRCGDAKHYTFDQFTDWKGPLIRAEKSP